MVARQVDIPHPHVLQPLRPGHERRFPATTPVARTFRGNPKHEFLNPKQSQISQVRERQTASYGHSERSEESRGFYIALPREAERCRLAEYSLSLRARRRRARQSPGLQSTQRPPPSPVIQGDCFVVRRRRTPRKDRRINVSLRDHRSSQGEGRGAAITRSTRHPTPAPGNHKHEYLNPKQCQMSQIRDRLTESYCRSDPCAKGKWCKLVGCSLSLRARRRRARQSPGLQSTQRPPPSPVIQGDCFVVRRRRTPRKDRRIDEPLGAKSPSIPLCERGRRKQALHTGYRFPSPASSITVLAGAAKLLISASQSASVGMWS